MNLSKLRYMRSLQMELAFNMYSLYKKYRECKRQYYNKIIKQRRKVALNKALTKIQTYRFYLNI